jgi:signal transduction histidine kinase/PAS domain-containing protein
VTQLSLANKTHHSSGDNVTLRNEIFAGDGEVGARLRAIEWSKTPLGPVQDWPQSLKTCIRIVLTSRQPMFVWWGDQLINIYNEAYIAVIGGKHPKALGRPAVEAWKEIWDQVGPRAESAMAHNEGTYDESLMLIMERYGYQEETYYTFSYSPVPNDQGGTGGIICANTDDTKRIVSERQLGLLGDLASKTADARTWQEACRLSAESLASNRHDICFALIYVVNSEEGPVTLAGATGLTPGHVAAPHSVNLQDESLWPFAQVLASHEISVLTDLDDPSLQLPRGLWPVTPRQGAAIHIGPSGDTGLAGVLIVGLNPFRQFDEGYKKFLTLVAAGISASIANAQAYEQEKKRAEALAEVDRAKTIFFSNVSHEFRTPLTLMLGPTEDALAAPQQSLHGKALETVHRNELRLLKLVNTLLDFSRLEAGRISASFRATDLSAFTAELASVFRSAVERAHLSYVVDAPALPHSVYLDREMWEKIILNLLSNALKSTFDGGIAVSVRDAGDHAEVAVRDTGTGIPKEELHTLFERFRRIENARRRTHEGSGIGLALANELVKMHGGEIRVQSTVNEGSLFTVSIPYGTAHLPASRVKSGGDVTGTGTSRSAYVQEALSWLSGESITPGSFDDLGGSDFDQPADEAETSQGGRVLLVDDNADMLEYVRQLLSSRFQVTTAPNGRVALEMARKHIPELVLTDVMMPEMDGFQLLHELRRNESTQSVPVILLSARAGEESRVEGMDAGADDYLIKPFTARELVARVDAHLRIARFRRQAIASELKLRQELDEARRMAAEAVENISDGFFMYDHEWRLTYANPAAERVSLINGNKDGLLGTTLWQVFPDLPGTDAESHYRRCMEDRVPVELEMSQGQRHYATRAHPSPRGGVVAYVADITARRRAESALQLKQEHLRMAQRAAGIAAWELDVEAEELTISPEFAEIVGLPNYVSRLRYEDFLNSLFVSSDRTQAEAAMQTALRGKKEFAVELRLKRPDGSVRLVSSRGKGFYNQGKPLVLGVLVNLTPESVDGVDGAGVPRPAPKKPNGKKALRKA